MSRSTPLINQFVALVELKEFDNSNNFVDDLAGSIVNDLQLRVIDKFSHAFSPSGSTLVYLLSQSHLAIHSWPEEKKLHIDLVVCQEISKTDFQESLKDYFNKENIVFLKIEEVDLCKE